MDIRKRLLLLSGKKRAAVPWYLAGGVAATDCVAAYQAIGAASYAASKVNIINPGTFDLTEINGAVDWSAANGWYKGTNSNKYLLTGITPSAAYTIIVRINVAGASYQYAFAGGEYSAELYGCATQWIDTSTTWFHLEKNTGISGLGDHVFAIANVNGYVDGVLKVNNARAPTTALLFFTNLGGTSIKIFAASIYSATLTQPQIAAIGAAMMSLP